MELTNRALAAHLSRRAGFGATPGELDSYCDIEYEQLVEELINKVDSSHISDHLIFRRHEIYTRCKATTRHIGHIE